MAVEFYAKALAELQEEYQRWLDETRPVTAVYPFRCGFTLVVVDREAARILGEER